MQLEILRPSGTQMETPEYSAFSVDTTAPIALPLHKWLSVNATRVSLYRYLFESYHVAAGCRTAKSPTAAQIQRV